MKLVFFTFILSLGCLLTTEIILNNLLKKENKINSELILCKENMKKDIGNKENDLITRTEILNIKISHLEWLKVENKLKKSNFLDSLINNTKDSLLIVKDELIQHDKLIDIVLQENNDLHEQKSKVKNDIKNARRVNKVFYVLIFVLLILFIYLIISNIGKPKF